MADNNIGPKRLVVGAHYGLRDWLAQRVTALGMVAYVAILLIAFLTGNELRFGLGAPEMVVMVASLVLCHISFSTGRTNVLNGAAHMALFAAYLMTIFA